MVDSPCPGIIKRSKRDEDIRTCLDLFQEHDNAICHRFTYRLKEMAQREGIGVGKVQAACSKTNVIDGVSHLRSKGLQVRVPLLAKCLELARQDLSSAHIPVLLLDDNGLEMIGNAGFALWNGELVRTNILCQGLVAVGCEGSVIGIGRCLGEELVVGASGVDVQRLGEIFVEDCLALDDGKAISDAAEEEELRGRHHGGLS